MQIQSTQALLGYALQIQEDIIKGEELIELGQNAKFFVQKKIDQMQERATLSTVDVIFDLQLNMWALQQINKKLLSDIDHVFEVLKNN